MLESITFVFFFAVHIGALLSHVFFNDSKTPWPLSLHLIWSDIIGNSKNSNITWLQKYLNNSIVYLRHSVVTPYPVFVLCSFFVGHLILKSRKDYH